MKVQINKQLIQEGVLQRLTDVHLGMDPSVDPEAADPVSGIPVPNPIVPTGAKEASHTGDRNLFMGQRSSDTYAGNHVVNQAKQTLKG